MIKLLHLIGSYGFTLIFIVAAALGFSAVRRHDAKLERLSAWCFLAAFTLLMLSYGTGFSLESAAKVALPESLFKAVEKHHNMAKFVLSSSLLMMAACIAVLARYRRERFPNWFLPNLLFLSLMVATFLVRTLISTQQMP